MVQILHQVECNEDSFHSVELSPHENHLDNDVGWLLHPQMSAVFVEASLFLSLPSLSCPSVLVSDKSPSDVLHLSPVITTSKTNNFSEKDIVTQKQ